jgi:predicted ArsR family transcriptional regulator
MQAMPTPDRLDRSTALADPSRRALLGVLRRATAPQDVRTLAAAVGLHPNSTREQLARLADAGLVRVATAAPNGRGRPGLRYQAVPEATGEPFRVLAAALAEGLSTIPDAPARSAAAGERWGRDAAATLSPTRPSDALAAVVGLMGEVGFEPELIDLGAGAQPVLRLHACPFLPMDERHLDIVCSVHLGFLRGALDALGAPVTAASIHPLETPDACSAHLETRTDA